MLSEGVGREDRPGRRGRGAARSGPIASRSPTTSVDQARGIEVPRHDARHVVGRHALDPRHELLEVVVGQVVQRELRDGARRSARRSRSCARSRASARRRRASSSAGVTGRGPRMPAISPSDSSIAVAVPLVCTLTCSDERARPPAEVERRARAVGEPLVLAQVQVDAADELAAEHHVGRRRARDSRACRARPATWPMRSSDCGAPGRGTTLRRAALRQRSAVGRLARRRSPVQPPNASAASRTIAAWSQSPTAISVATPGRIARA